MDNGDRRLSNRPHREQDLSSDMKVLDELLDTLTDILDIREVFDRVSQVVQPVLPHDLMGIAEVNEAIDRVRVHVAAGSADIPRNYEVAVPEPDLLRKPWDFLMIEDLPMSIFRRRWLRSGIALTVPDGH
jgi:hypothetical protein